MIFLTLLLGTACQHDVRSPYAACADLEYEGRQFCKVSFIELLGNPDALNGMDVAVQGVVFIEQPSGLAYLRPSLEEKWLSLPEFWVRIGFISDLVSLNLSDRENEYVMVQGKFVWDPKEPNMYRRNLTHIELISGSPLKVP